MFAPSTVMLIGMPMYAWPSKLRGPREMPAPPTMSMASLIAVRHSSVVLSFIIAVTTAGFAHESSAPQV